MIWVDYKGFIGAKSELAIGFKDDINDNKISFWIPKSCIGSIETEKSGELTVSNCVVGDELTCFETIYKFAKENDLDIIED